MKTTEYLKSYANPSTHIAIDKLTIEQKERVKNLINELTSKTNRDFEISELKILNDRLEVGVIHKITMYQ